MSDKVRMVIVGADTPMGAEVARLAVSMGFEVIGLTSGEVDRIEPWQHGVEWKGLNSLDSETLGATAVVWAEKTDLNCSVVIPDITRQVYFDAEAPVAALSANTVWLISEGVPPLPLEQRAIAVLRAAVEDGHNGVISHEEVAYLGDAMMLQ